MTELQTVESSSEDHQLEIKSEETSESHGKDIIELKDTSDEVEAKCSAKEKTDNSESAPKGIFALKKELEHEDTTAKDVAKSKLTRVTINVVRARNLSKTSKFGKADPYVLVSIDEKKFKSVKVANSSNPEWNFVNTVYVDKESTTEFSVEVYDEDTFTKDDFMGRVSLKNKDLSRLQQGQWIPLEGCKSGEILISAEIVDDVEGAKDQLQFLTTSDKNNEVRDDAEIKTIIILEKKDKSKLPEQPDDVKLEKTVSQDEKISDVEKISTESASEMERKTTELMREDAYFVNVSDVTEKKQEEADLQPVEKPTNANDKTGIAAAAAAAASVAAASIGGRQVVEDIKISFDSTDEANSKAGSEITETTVESADKAEVIEETRIEDKFEEDSARRDMSPEKIELIVHAARDLPKKGMFGKADPYVVISLGDQKLKSATINNTYNPQWDLKTTLHVQPNAPRDISIVVLDEDVGQDDLVGEIFLNIDDLVKVGGLKDAWVPLGGCKSGEVQISSSIMWESQSTNSENQNLTPLSTLTDKSKSPTPTILITSAPDAQIDLSDNEEEYENAASQNSRNVEEIKTEVPEHKEDQDNVIGTIEDPAISIAAKEVVDAVTAKAVEKVAAIAKAEDEERQNKKQAALEDPKIISAARKVVDQATSDAVEKVVAMQAGHPAVVIGGPNEQAVDPVEGENKDVSGVSKVKELLQGEILEEGMPADNKGQKT